MLIHDRFVFLHVPKTGGSFVRRALERELGELRAPPGGRQANHYGWDEIPPWATDRPVLVFARNPWDWYVSWYHFVIERLPKVPRALEPDASFTDWLMYTSWHCYVAASANLDARPSPFAAAVRRACGGGGTGAIPRDSAALQPIERLSRRLIEGEDIYSATLLASIGAGIDSDRLTIGRLESLVEDLDRFLRRAGVPLADGSMARIRADAPSNASARGPYRAYYDDGLSDLVGASCNGMIERFGYRF